MTDWNDLTQFRCQKHGDIGTITMTVSIAPKGQPAQSFNYCMFCFNEMMAKHCHQATPASNSTGEVR